MNEDPRRTYFKLLLTLNMAVPDSAEKFIDEFQIPEGVPEETRKLMAEAIDTSLIRLKRIEEKLERLRNSLLSESGGEKR